jgi:hypothetical protein
MVYGRNRNRNLSKVETGTVKNSYGSAKLVLDLKQCGIRIHKVPGTVI